MNRDELVDFIDNYYVQDIYSKDIEDILCWVADVDSVSYLSDEDDYEGIYANFTTRELEEVVELIKRDLLDTAITLHLTKQELNSIINALETYSNAGTTKDKTKSIVASKLLDRLYDL